MNKTHRDFAERSLLEREWLLKHTWCDRCEKADLGMRDPLESEIDGQVVVEGSCVKCGDSIRSAVDEVVVD